MPKKESHQPKSYLTDMAHPKERKDCYISRDIVRFSLVPLSVLHITQSRASYLTIYSFRLVFSKLLYFVSYSTTIILVTFLCPGS